MIIIWRAVGGVLSPAQRGRIHSASHRARRIT